MRTYGLRKPINLLPGHPHGIGNWLYDRTTNVTFCGQSCPGFARSGDRRRAACRRRGEAGCVRDVCPSQTDYAPPGMSRSGSAAG
jgi:hypothetical protein